MSFLHWHCQFFCLLANSAGGWSADAHLLFVQLRGMCLKAVGLKGTKLTMINQLAQMMPGYTSAQLAEHEQW